MIPGVADRIPDTIRSLVFLDAEIAQDGKSLVDMADEFASYREAWDRGEAAIPVANPAPLLTPQPLGTFLEPAHLTGAWTSVAKKTFVKAMPNEFPALMDAYLSVKDRPGWTTLEIEGPHVFPITMPEATAQLLEDAI